MKNRITFSKVVGLKEMCNCYFCVNPKNVCLMKKIKKHCYKKGTCDLLQLWCGELLKVVAFVKLQISIMILFKINQRFKGHFLNELRFSFNHQVYNKIMEVFL